jgi:hypothetical protein
MSMERLLEASKTQALRDAGVVKPSEVVKIVGDVCVAEDVVSGARRLLPNITEQNVPTQNRRILRD